ncbi:MAG: AI-2E family transporter [bacterium]|nr:AI-2E family transporter [bacterium]
MGEQKEVKQQVPEPEKKNSDWNLRPYLALGAVTFLVFCCCMAVVFVIFKYESVKRVWDVVAGVLQPIVIGAVLAYLLNPLMRRTETLLSKAILPKAKNQEKTKKTIRTIASVFALLVFLLVVVFVFYLIVPAVIESITNLVNSMSDKVDEFIDWYNSLGATERAPKLWETYLLEASAYIEKWFNESMVPELKNYASTITEGVIGVFVLLKNVLVGLIVSIYVLMEKEHFEGLAKKILFAILPTRQSNNAIQIVHKVDQIFGGFIMGKLIDSAIIGALCFVGCAILRMPYTLLVSVIIGITNIIPFFGPLIGAIPCILIITITDPLHGLYFIIFVLVLQQLDGNVIGPKILGDSTGLSSFWVIFAILVSGGLFGFAGMLIGVPAFAVIYYLIQRFIAYLLGRRKLPTETMDYTYVTHVDTKTRELKSDGWAHHEPYRKKSKK